MLHRLLLFPDDAAGTTQTPKTVKSEGERETTIPADVKNLTFSVEQLPQLSEDEGHQVLADDKVKPSRTETELERKAEEKVIEKPEEKKDEAKPTEGELTEEKEVKEEGPLKFLKPPKGSEAEKAKKKGSNDTFDYSGFSEDETSILKNMPVGNRDKVGKLFKEHKELQELKGKQFYENENGYLLDPNYHTELHNIEMVQKESQIWGQQLRLCKEGKAFKPLTGWDKNGNPVYGAEIKPTDEIEEEIRLNIGKCRSIVEQKNTAVKNYVANFQNTAKSDLKMIHDENTKKFAWVANPELLKYSIEFDGMEKPISTIKSDFISLFPAYMRGSPILETASNLMVSLVIARAENNELKKGAGAKVIKQEEEELLEPKSGAKPRRTTEESVAKGVPKTFSTEGMNLGIGEM